MEDTNFTVTFENFASKEQAIEFAEAFGRMGEQGILDYDDVVYESVIDMSKFRENNPGKEVATIEIKLVK